MSCVCYGLKPCILDKADDLFLSERDKHYGYYKKGAFKKLPEHFGGRSVLTIHRDTHAKMTTPGGGVTAEGVTKL
jgi:hypothetical protein